MSNMNHLKEEEQKLDIIVSTLKDIKELLEKLVPKEIVVNNVVMSPIEKDKPIYDFFIDDTESKKEIREKVLREAKRLDKEECKLGVDKLSRVIDLLELVAEQNNEILTNTSTSKKVLATQDIVCFEVSKALYKKQVDTGKYIKVAFITGDGKVRFLARNENLVESPNYYEATWYYLNEVGELRYSTFDMVNVNEIYVDSSLEDGNYYVTGYINDKGKAIYYDQYII